MGRKKKTNGHCCHERLCICS